MNLLKSRTFMKSSTSIWGIDIDLIISLLPCLIFGIIKFGFNAFIVILTSIISSVLSEYIFNYIKYKKIVITDLSSVITGLILGLSMPSETPFWYCIIGSIFAIILCKCVFGGLGKNIVNPAICSRIFLILCFPAFFSNSSLLSTATPLSSIKEGVTPDNSVFNTIIGNINGAIGEVSSIAIIAGLIYLLIRRVIRYEQIITYFTTLILLFIVFPKSGNSLLTIYQLFSGSILFCGVFCITDPVTSPSTPIGRYIFGFVIAIIVFLIRYFGSYNEGTAFAILVANLLVPLIDSVSYNYILKNGGNYKK